MKRNKLITAMALSMSLTLISCSDDAEKTTQQQTTTNAATSVASQVQSESAIMSYIPAETPLLMMYVKDENNPIPQKLMDNMGKVYNSIGDMIKMSIADNKNMGNEKSAEIDAFINKWFSEDGMEKLGIAMDENEIAIYTVDLFPVARLTLAKSHKMGEVLEELMTMANEEEAGSGTKKEVDGIPVYQFGDKEFQVMVSLNGNSVAASFAPTREVDRLMPTLLGFEKPSKNISQSNQYNDTINKYNYLGNNVYWVNLRQIADYFVNPAQYDSAMLDVMKVQDNMFSADCKTEILAMVDKFPRIVGGTTLMNDNNLNSHMIVELTDGLGSKLAKTQGRIPRSNTEKSVTYGFSFDIAAAKEVALEFVTNIETVPYKCEMLASMNQQAMGLKAQLSQPLPPFVSNFKGMNFVIDELDLDMTQTEPSEMIKSLKAKVLLAVDNPEAIQGMASMAMPDLQNLGLKTGGDAVNITDLIPIKGTQIPINLDYVFLAMGSETIGLSLGEGTDPDLKQDVSSESDSHLLSLRITSELYKNLFASLASMDSLPEEAKSQLQMQQAMMSDMLWWETETFNLDFTDRGLEIGVDIKY